MDTGQRYEIDAWLGDDHDLTDEQIDQLGRTAERIGERHPDPDDEDERREALTAAYRLMVEDPDTVVDELTAKLTRARTAEAEALAGLRQAAVTLIENGDQTEAGFARRVGVDRMAVREWLGKRRR